MLPARAASEVPIPDAAFAAAIASYESEPTTESLSQGSAMPSDLDRATTVITIEIAGATVNMAAVLMVLFISVISIPFSFARLYAFKRKYADCPSTAAIMIPTSTNRTGWLTWNSIFFSFPLVNTVFVSPIFLG